ncbi:MAG: hypothetical protein AB9869_13220 [Verrucomicrobiia bacterium]
MSLDIAKLKNVQRKEDGTTISQCPACAASGADTKGNHLFIRNEKYGCVAHPGDHDHRKEIFRLVGIVDGEKCSGPIPVPIRRPSYATQPPRLLQSVDWLKIDETRSSEEQLSARASDDSPEAEDSALGSEALSETSEPPERCHCFRKGSAILRINESPTWSSKKIEEQTMKGFVYEGVFERQGWCLTPCTQAVRTTAEMVAAPVSTVGQDQNECFQN